MFFGGGWEAKREWWRMGIRLPGGFIADLEWNVGNTDFSFLFNGGLAYLAARKFAVGICASVAALCSTIVFVIASYYYKITAVNKYYCNSSGVWVYKNHIFPFMSPVVLVAGLPYVTC